MVFFLLDMSLVEEVAHATVDPKVPVGGAGQHVSGFSDLSLIKSDITRGISRCACSFISIEHAIKIHSVFKVNTADVMVQHL